MVRPRGRQLPRRVSVALSEEQHEALSALAERNGSSVAWVVRRAVIDLLAGQDKDKPMDAAPPASERADEPE